MSATHNTALLISYSATHISRAYLVVQDRNSLTDAEIIDLVLAQLDLNRTQIRAIDATTMAANIIVHFQQGSGQVWTNILRPKSIPCVTLE